MRPGADRGLALPLVVLLLVALTALAHGALLLSTAQASAARGWGRWVGGRVAEDARRLALGRAVLTDTVPTVAVGDRVPLGETAADTLAGPVHLVRLGAELYGVRSRRWMDLLWVLDPAARVAGTEGVVTAGGGVSGSGVTVSAVRDPAPSEAAACAPLLDAVDRRGGGWWLPTARAELPVWDSVPGPPALGALAPDTLLGRLRPVPPGSGTPGPGACLADDPWNWGSPSDPDGACGEVFATVGVRGALTVLGGEGQGLLVVEGDLEISGDALFRGLVVAGGDLRLSSGARIEGLVRVRGRVELGSGTRIEGRACPALIALQSAAPLRRPHLPKEPVPLQF